MNETYFLRCVSIWKAFDLGPYEISISLHKEGHTKLFKPYGFVLDVEPEGIRAAYAADVTSQMINGQKFFSEKSKAKHWIDYKNNLDELLENTPKGRHNEIFINPQYASIIGIFSREDVYMKKFVLEAKRRNLPHYIFKN